MPRALRNIERMRGNIHILILNIFGYETLDSIVQSIHLHSYTLVQFKSRQSFSKLKSITTHQTKFFPLGYSKPFHKVHVISVLSQINNA